MIAQGQRPRFVDALVERLYGFATLAAIRRASSRVTSLAADRPAVS